MVNRVCPVCGGVFAGDKNAKYCSEACARKAHRKGVYNKRDVKSREKVLDTYMKRELAIYGYNKSCAICGWTLQDKDGRIGCEVHHIIPVAEGGGELGLGNCILLCPNCHKEAHIGVLTREFLQSKVLIHSEKDLNIAKNNALWNL